MQEKIKKAQFDFSYPLNIIALFTNPFYFVRKNLYRNIKYFSRYLNGNLMDFGCGAKPYEDLFVNCTQYIGVDVEASGHDHTNENVDIYYDGITLPFNDGEFDSAFSSEVFEHVNNIGPILDEINRVLKKGGNMLVSTPFLWNEHEIPYDYYRYTSYGITKLLEEHGFKVIKIRKSTSYTEMIFQMKIEYIRSWRDKHIKNPNFRRIFHRLIITPITISGLIANMVLPKNESLYGDSVVLCKKCRNSID